MIGNLLIPVPIIQGGMGVGISLSNLASAVANEGGVGVISSAGLGLLYRKYSHDFIEASNYGLKEEIRKAREKTRGILGVNIMVAMTNFADSVKVAIAEKIDIIFSGAGLPLDLPSYLGEQDKTKLVPIVSSGRAAKLICDKWQNNYNYLPDAIVVEGPKAGGHLGFKINQIDSPEFSLQILIKDVLEVVKKFEEKFNKKIPVIAAGGIYTGSDIKEFLDLGASAVQMGTRFVTTDECDASIEFKNTYINAKKEDIEIIKSPVGMPGRAIVNDFLHKVKEGKKHPSNCPFKCIKTCDINNSEYCIISALYNAYNGNFNNGFSFAGANAYLSDKINTVKDVFESLKKEYSNAMSK